MQSLLLRSFNRVFLCAAFLLAASVARSQDLYVRAFGKPGDVPLIFLHGGPGYNSAGFEGTMAQKLADAGFYVIVYDRRGEGRSIDPAAAFTFSQTFSDLDTIYSRYHLKKATLIGHSFGGVVATLYAEKAPQKVSSVVLVSAPVALQETFRTILRSSKKIYADKGDTASLKYIAMLEKMDTASIAYSSYTFQHAMQNGFYWPKTPSEESKAVYATFRKDTALARQSGAMTFGAPQGFMKNERYTSIDLAPVLRRLVRSGLKIYGLYGREDGLYSPEQVAQLAGIIGAQRLKYLDNCSHNVFADQQQIFIMSLKTWLK